MNTNQKGVKGLIKVMDDLISKGYYTFPAFDDHSPVDLIAMDHNGKITRLQIKYRSRMPKLKLNRYELHARSIVNGKVVPIDRSLIDAWAIFLVDDNKVAYVPVEAMTNKNLIHIDPKKDYGGLAEWSKAAHC